MEVSPLRQVRKEKGAKKTKWVLKLKSVVTWKAIKMASSSTTKLNRFHLTCASSMKQLSLVRVQAEEAVKPIQQAHTKKKASHVVTKSLLSLLQLPYTASDFIDWGDLMTPTKSPKENISTKWREIHGLHNWDSLLDPLHPWLRREIIKYGEFAQATYDGFEFDPLSEFCGSCRYNRHKLFEELGLTNHGYKVTKYIYAMSHVDVPSWFERSHLGETWSKDSNWMGYVAVSNDEESERIGRRDIVMAWRGTIAPTEWFTDLKAMFEPIGDGKIKVQHGFCSIYNSKSELTRYNKLSASEQVMEEVNRLVKFYKAKGEEISFTITGHSLGGALALLNAYEAATSIPGLPISVISFGAPRVGNLAFKEKLDEMGVKTLRIVVKQDIVPKFPGFICNNILHKLNFVTKKFNWVYRHVGSQLELDMFMSPYLKRESDLIGSHNLEIYLHHVDGFLSKQRKFRWNARRDVALVNKTTDMLIEELRIPKFWYQLPYKGLVLNKHGRWVKPSREPEDVPSPLSVASKNELH
ncbi:phospholipase A1-Igamma1, chloroplastic-like [Quercus lobata]|nr:phospholipase A1-Igamma1, chloroplastic-like [Quercus lobata]